MKINVRMSGSLAQKVGVSRFQTEVDPVASVDDLLNSLSERYPQISAELSAVVIVTGGVIQSKSARLQEGQEVALLLPVAGG